MNLRSEERNLDLILFSVFTILTAVLSFRALVDVDIGWHLAGGLWILDQGTLPWRDPLGAQGNFWLCYSWLIEVVFALVYRWFDFRGLQILQLLMIVVSVWWLLIVVRKVNANRHHFSVLDRRFVELVAFAISILLLAPVWHLRPQLISVMLFGWLLLLGRESRLTAFYVLPITVFWANVHIYWVAAPAMVGLFRIFEPLLRRNWIEVRRGSSLLLFTMGAGLLNPYTFHLYAGVFEYLLSHQDANRLIKEFQPLTPKSGVLFWLTTLIWIGLIWRRREILRSESLGSIVLLIVCGAFSFKSRKYLPLFGVVVTPALVNEVIPGLMLLLGPKNKSSVNEKLASQPMTKGQKRLIAGLALMLISLIVSSFEFADPLPRNYGSLFRDAKHLIASAQQSHGASKINVLNHFDQGGWLALAFYLNRPSGEVESPFKTVIDGRTLVMGQQRIREFSSLFLNPEKSDVCGILAEWNPSFALIPAQSKLVSIFKNQRDKYACLTKWKIESEEEDWLIAIKE